MQDFSLNIVLGEFLVVGHHATAVNEALSVGVDVDRWGDFDLEVLDGHVVVDVLKLMVLRIQRFDGQRKRHFVANLMNISRLMT